LCKPISKYIHKTYAYALPQTEILNSEHINKRARKAAGQIFEKYYDDDQIVTNSS